MLCLITGQGIDTTLLGAAVEVMVLLVVTMMMLAATLQNSGTDQSFCTVNTQAHLGCNSIHLPSSHPTTLLIVLMLSFLYLTVFQVDVVTQILSSRS